MTTQFVKILFDVYCKHKGDEVPAYRVFVNDELFTERTWIWRNHYLEEMLQIAAEPGAYRIRIEAVRPMGGKFRCYNHRVEHGPARWIDDQTVEIQP